MRLPRAPRRFQNVDRLLEAARQMFQARKKADEARSREDDEQSRKKADQAGQRAEAWDEFFHASFELTGDKVALCRRCRECGLEPVDREILVALVLERLGLLDDSLDDCGDFLRFLRVPGDKLVDALRRMSENGRLYKSKLFVYEDEYYDLRDRKPVLDPQLLDEVIFEQNGRPSGWSVRTQTELYSRLACLTDALERKADEGNRLLRGYGCAADFFKLVRKVKRLLSGLDSTLSLHRNWGLSRLFALPELGKSKNMQLVLLILLGKELGHREVDCDLFKGKHLAVAGCASIDDATVLMTMLLGGEGKLIKAELVQPAGGQDELLADDPAALGETEFELGPRSLEILGLDKQRRKRRQNGPEVRKPLVSMSQLVLSDEVHEALRMACAQARDSGVLMKDWGLGKIIPYGRSPALLFTGPPGVGKTACAEALAGLLGKQILVADYSQIQNCFVGVTEKNIVRTFRTAKQHDAVLFWDEADAMFFDRDSAARNWEVRDVNVLLQEIERFEGVCILATNRKVSLDPALERRISLRVEFERPNRAMRKKIWRKLLPRKLPKSKDLDLEALSEADLSGGEIKNVVLNAARMALVRGKKSRVTMADLRKAVELETGRRLDGCNKKPIGFSAERRKKRKRR